MYACKREFANTVDPDQTSQNAASEQGLHCLHKTRHPFYMKESKELRKKSSFDIFNV